MNKFTPEQVRDFTYYLLRTGWATAFHANQIQKDLNAAILRQTEQECEENEGRGDIVTPPQICPIKALDNG